MALNFTCESNISSPSAGGFIRFDFYCDYTPKTVYNTFHGGCTKQLLTWTVKSLYTYDRYDGDPLTSLLAYIMAKFIAKILAHYSTACTICLLNTSGADDPRCTCARAVPVRIKVQDRQNNR